MLALARHGTVLISPCVSDGERQKAMTRFDAVAMNRLCQALAGEGAVEVNYHGMRPANIDALACAAVKAIARA